jgi:enoyl-CoA hydratase/carnithine racemase
MSERQFVKVTTEDRVAIITIDHAPVNALDQKTMAELAEVVVEVIADPNVKAAIIIGGGQMAFVAGADINEFTKLTTPEEARGFIEMGQSTFNKIENSPKPFIAAINGVALGGGMELAMACHIRIAGDRARLGQPEINLGIIPGWGGTQRLTRIVGPAKASELILTGDNLTAQEAYRLNLVNKVVPGGEVLKTAKDLAKKIAGKGAVAIAATLDSISKARDAALEAGLAVEAANVSKLVATEDAKEGITAFLSKRQPVFKDR